MFVWEQPQNFQLGQQYMCAIKKKLKAYFKTEKTTAATHTYTIY